MIEIASLVGRLQIQLDGVRQAKQELVQIENQMRSLGNVSELELTKMANASDRATLATEKYARAIAEVQQVQEEVNSTFKDSADPLAELNRQYEVAQGKIASASTELDAFTESLGLSSEEVERLTSLLESGAGAAIISKALQIDRGMVDQVKELYEIQQKGVEGLSPELQKVVELHERYQSAIENSLSSEAQAISKREGLNRIIEAAKKAMEEMNEEQEKAGEGAASLGDILKNKLGFSMSQLGQIMRVLLQGRFSLSQFTALMGRAAVAMAPLLAALSPVIAGFAVFRSRLGQLGQQISQTRPEIVALATDIQNIDLSTALTQLETFSNRLSSFGFENGDQVARDIFGIAESIQALNSTPNDLPQVAQIVQQAVESANLSGLRDFDLDINITEVNRKLQEVRARFGETAAQAEAFGILAQVAMNKAAEGGRRASEEASSLQSITSRLRGMWDEAIANNKEFQDSVAQLGDTLQGIVSEVGPLIGVVVDGMQWVLDMTDRLALGFESMANNALIHLDRISAGIIGFAREIAGVLENIPFIGEPLVGLLPEGATSGRWEEELTDLAAYREGLVLTNAAISEMRGWGPGGEWNTEGREADFIANWIQSLLQFSDTATIGVEAIERLQRAVDGSNSDVRAATKWVLDNAEAFGLTAEQVRELTQAYNVFEKRTDDAAAAIPEVTRTLEDLRKAARSFVQEAQGGAGVTDALASIGEASLALREDASPANALQFFQAYSRGIEEALNGGADKIIAFREFVEQQLRPSLSTDEYKAIIDVLDATEAAFAPLATEADRLAGANVTAAEATSNTAARFGDLNLEALNAQAGVQGLTGSLIDYEQGGPYTADLILNQVVKGGVPSVGADLQFPFAGALKGTGGSGTSTSTGSGAPSNYSPGSVAKPPAPPPTGAPSNYTPGARAESLPGPQGAIAAAIAAKDAAAAAEANAKNLRDRTEDLAKLLDRGGRGGGGGGDTGLDVEEIKRFLQEVNRAIAIASREGVRIGTAGNAIPFEEGSFLNAEGGGLSVDTILIRGVWDFADPAAKRQIINELQEALTALQAEV